MPEWAQIAITTVVIGLLYSIERRLLGLQRQMYTLLKRMYGLTDADERL